MSLNEPSVGVTTGPTWATDTNSNWESIDTHDHTSGKGVQLTPSALNVNSDLEFNQNSATELKNVIFDSSVTAATTNYSVYQASGNLYWRNGSGTAVQITDGSGINTSGGSISNMTGNSQVQYSGVNKSYTFKFDSTLTDGIAKIVNSDMQLYYYNSGSATTRSVNLKYTGSGTGSNTLTVPDETGTLLSTASSVADISVTSTTASKPDVVIANNANDATGPFLNLKNLRGVSNAGVANDDCGTIQFYGNDAANNNQVYAKVLAEVSDPTSGGEEGKISISVAEYDGTVTPGLILTGSSTDGEVDVTIGAGTSSVTSIAGTLDLGDRAILNVGDIDCDSISVADATVGLDLVFGGNTTLNTITLTDHLADALNITESTNSYLKFVTTNSSEQIVFGQNSTFASTTIANLGTVTTADINGGTWQGTIDGSWTAASQTCADLGTVTTADINGGTVDGANVTVGSSKTLDVSAGTLTTSTAQKQAIVDGATIVTVPTGMIGPFANNSVPTGWLFCDGSSVSRSTYSDLFGVIGTTWGSDDSSTFNVPDLQGAFLRGTGSNGTHNMADGNDFAGPSVGSFEDDAFQGHYHNWGGYKDFNNGSQDAISGNGQGGYGGQSGSTGGVLQPKSDGSNGGPRTADETRPFNAGVKYCIKT